MATHRYDYDADTAEFVLRMPTTLHDTFARTVTDEILSAIHALQVPGHTVQQATIQKAIENIRKRDGDIYFGKGKKLPDGQIESGSCSRYSTLKRRRM